MKESERGAAMVEFALVLPVLLVVVLAGMSLLWVLAARSDLTAAAKAGARYAAIPIDPMNCQPEDQPCGLPDWHGYFDYPNREQVAKVVNDKAALVTVADGDVQLCHRNDSEADLCDHVDHANDSIVVTVSTPVPDIFRPFAGLIGAGARITAQAGEARSE